MPANFKKFDVKHGLSVNGLEFVDENRNVTLNNLTVQGTSTVVDTRTVTQTDPIIGLGVAGKTLSVSGITVAGPGRISVSGIVGDSDSTAADAFADIAVGDSFQYNSTGNDATPLVSGQVYYVVAKDTDVTSSTYRTFTFSSNQGGTASTVTNAGSGTQTIILNPLRDLGQDLGIEFNYVDSGAKKGFFGFDDSTGHFTFLKDTTYRGQSTQSDDGTPNLPDFIGTKSGAEFSYAKLEPTNSLTSNQSALDIDQTWNNAGATFKAIEVDVVDTNSAASSSLLDITSGGRQRLLLRKDGVLSLNTANQTGVLTLVQDANTQSSTLKLIDASGTWNDGTATFVGIDLNVTRTNSGVLSKLVNFSINSVSNYSLNRFALATHKAEFSGGGLQTAYLLNVTDSSSDANSLLLDLQVGGTSKFSVDKDGDVIAQGSLTAEGNLVANGFGNFENAVAIQSQINGSGTYTNTTEIQTATSTISAGSSAAATFSSFTATSFTTAKVLVQVKQGSNIHSTELLLIHDGTDVWLTEYGTIYNSDILVTFDAVVTGSNVVIQATNTAASVTANALTTIKTTRTAITA